MALHERGDVMTSRDAADTGVVSAPDVNATELLRENRLLREANAKLERATEAVWRENARLARLRFGHADAAAAAELTRTGRRLLASKERCRELEAEVERLSRLLATPRHQAVERARDRTMRRGSIYWLVRRVWKLVAKG